MKNKDKLNDIIDTIMYDDAVFLREEEQRLKNLFIEFGKFVSNRTDIEVCYEQFMEVENLSPC